MTEAVWLLLLLPLLVSLGVQQLLRRTFRRYRAVATMPASPLRKPPGRCSTHTIFGASPSRPCLAS
jgi:hypothetical protein